MNKTKALKIKTDIISWVVVFVFILLGFVNPTIRIELLIISAVLFGILTVRKKRRMKNENRNL